MPDPNSDHSRPKAVHDGVKKFDINKELQDKEFRVAIFGSARIKPDDPIYKETFELAKAIGGMGMDLVTGGGPGLMEAASTGHTEGDTENKAQSIGLNIRLPFEQKLNPGLETANIHERFSTRLDEFMLLSHAMVVMPGGVGTCLEFFYTWQLLQVNHVCRMPIILVGDMWRNLMKWVIDNPLKHGYLSSKDLQFIVLANTGEHALAVVKKAKEYYDKAGPKSCANWQKYGEKF